MSHRSYFQPRRARREVPVIRPHFRISLVLAAIIGVMALLVALPALAQEPGAPAGLDFEGLLVGLVLPYVASALSVASMTGVFKWLMSALQYTRLAPFAGLFLKAPGEKKLRPAQVAAIRVLVAALSFAGAWGGAVAPLGGESAGVFGIGGAACLVALMSMGVRDGLRATLKRRAKGA
jgi:hypothetical protein